MQRAHSTSLASNDSLNQAPEITDAIDKDGHTEFSRILLQEPLNEDLLAERIIRGAARLPQTGRFSKQAILTLCTEKKKQQKYLFFLACFEGDIELAVKMLAANEQLLEARDFHGYSGCLYAASSGCVEIAQWFLNLKPDAVNDKASGNNAFLMAAFRGRIKFMEWFLTVKPDALEEHNHGVNAFLMAAFAGHIDVAKWFLTLKPDALNDNANGYNALLLDAFAGHIDVAKWFLTLKPEALNDKTSSGQTALDLAIQSGQSHFVLFLLKETRLSVEQKVRACTYFLDEFQKLPAAEALVTDVTQTIASLCVKSDSLLQRTLPQQAKADQSNQIQPTQHTALTVTPANSSSAAIAAGFFKTESDNSTSNQAQATLCHHFPDHY